MCYNISMDRDRVKILGYCVDKFTMGEAVDYAMTNGGLVVTLNPEMIENAKSTPDFSKILTDASLIIPDGIGIEIGLKLLGHKVKRIAGIEFAHSVIEECAKNSKSIALVGAKPEVISLAAENLQKEFENLKIVYAHDGYFEDASQIINDLKDAQPYLVLAALGSPKQEIFLNNLKEKLPDSVLIGVGGSFDVWSGCVKRAPKIYRNLGLEWLYRTIKEPKRLKRIFPTLPIFVLRVLKERLFPC